ncbi:DMT family transporter, partial [Actinomadura miaoliensis]|uniref:DMT family transporter n=1 Tax=Actinomadura miaoliensis TaxID=430685 RepID=UPI0031EBE9D8
GTVARRSTELRALIWCVPAGLVVVLVAALAAGGSPTGPATLWGLGAGLAGGAGLIVFFRALARGPMSVIAPVSALSAAVLPVAVGTMRGERLAIGVLVGVLLCLVAIALVSMQSDPASADAADTAEAVPIIREAVAAGQVDDGRAMAPVPGPGAVVEGGAGDEPRAGAAGPWPVMDAGRRRRQGSGGERWRVLDDGPIMAGISGACFAAFFILLKGAGDDAGLWPLVAARTGNLLVVGAAVIVVMRLRGALTGPPVSGRFLVGMALLSGALDAFSNALYFVAAQRGVLSLAAVLTSLYPAITVLLARIVHGERLRGVQRIGLVVAGVGVALVTTG